MRILIQIDKKEIKKQMKNLTKLTEDLGRELIERNAQKAVEIIKNEIEFGEFDTGDPTYKAIGLVDTGEFLRSIDYEIRERDGVYTAIVGSTDPKAADLEYGTSREDHTNLTVEEMEKWAAEKGFQNPKAVAKNLTWKIKRFGTAPKAPFRQALSRIENNVDNVKEDVKTWYDQKKKSI